MGRGSNWCAWTVCVIHLLCKRLGGELHDGDKQEFETSVKTHILLSCEKSLYTDMGNILQ